MPDSDDREYYSKRATTERERAAGATDPAIRKVHAEMAGRYEALAISEQAQSLRRQSSR